jgi:hypothetical protein
MPTDYKKLRELCPELEKQETELRQELPDVAVYALINTVGNVSHDALQAQPELAEEQRQAFGAQERALAKGDRKAADTAFTDAYGASKKSMDNLRDVCRAPSPPPLVS